MKFVYLWPRFVVLSFFVSWAGLCWWLVGRLFREEFASELAGGLVFFALFGSFFLFLLYFFTFLPWFFWGREKRDAMSEIRSDKAFSGFILGQTAASPVAAAAFFLSPCFIIGLLVFLGNRPDVTAGAQSLYALSAFVVGILTWFALLSPASSPLDEKLAPVVPPSPWEKLLGAMSLAHRGSRVNLRRLIHESVADDIGLMVNRWWIGFTEAPPSDDGETVVDGGQVIAPRSDLPLLVVGPSGAGKSSALVVPNAILHDGPMVITSTKDELMRMLAPGLIANGQKCFVFDPLASVTDPPPGVERVSWDVLGGCESWDLARRRATLMVAAASSASRITSGSRSDSSSFWDATGANCLSALLFGCAVTARNVRSLVDVVATLGVLGSSGGELTAFGQLAEDVEALKNKAGAGSTEETELSLCMAAIVEAEATIGGSSGGDNSSSLRLTVSRALTSLRSASVLSVLDTGSALEVGELVSEGYALFLVAETEEQEAIAPLFVGLLNDVVERTYAANRQGVTVETLLLLDELAQLAPLRNLPQLIAEGRGKGLRIMAVLQDLSQAEAVWGNEGNAFPTKFPHTLVLPGMRDREFLETLSTLTGQYEYWYSSMSYTRGSSSSSTESHQMERRARLEPSDIAALERDTALLLSPAQGNMGWGVIALAPHFKNKVHKQPFGDFINQFPAVDLTQEQTSVINPNRT